MFVPQSRKRPRLEQGVIFLDDEPELENNPSGSRSLMADTNSQAAGLSSSCCVSTLQTLMLSYTSTMVSLIHGSNIIRTSGLLCFTTHFDLKQYEKHVWMIAEVHLAASSRVQVLCKLAPCQDIMMFLDAWIEQSHL